MKLAVYTVSLPEFDLEQSVAVLKEMGYEGVEWRVDVTEGESPLKAMFAGLVPHEEGLRQPARHDQSPGQGGLRRLAVRGGLLQREAHPGKAGGEHRLSEAADRRRPGLSSNPPGRSFGSCRFFVHSCVGKNM